MRIACVTYRDWALAIYDKLAPMGDRAQCDQILVLEQGTVVEQGTHEELIGLGAVYHRLSEEATGSGVARG